MDFEKIELNSVGISVGCRIAVSRTLQGNFGYFATRKTGQSCKKTTEEGREPTTKFTHK